MVDEGNTEKDLFNELANDPDIVAAVNEHEEACAIQPGMGCIVCTFFGTIHELRHMSEIFASEKLAEIATPDFFSDAMIIVQFLSEATQYFIENEVAWSPDEDIDD